MPKRVETVTIEDVRQEENSRLSEDAWRSHVRTFLADVGYDMAYHTYRSDRSDPGFFDDVLMHRSGLSMICIEAKRETGKLSVMQVAWLDRMARFRDLTGAPICVYGALRPSDRDRLVATFYRRATELDGGLHQWCFSESCKRCMTDRAQATPYRPRSKARRRARLKTF